MSDDNGDLGKILCPFCSAPWTPENIQLYVSNGADYGTSQDSAEYELKLVCHSCKRVMYARDGDAYHPPLW